MRLDLVVGPNGAGKSTFVNLTLAEALPAGTPFVNADIIAASRWPDAAEEHSYEAAQVAAQTRAALIARGEPLIAETVFSHPSKLELVREAHRCGYYVALHVLLVPMELSIARVAERVRQGGHSVPEDKVRSRYERLWPLVAQAVALCDIATVYDNSHYNGPRLAAKYQSGLLIGTTHWPIWTPSVLVDLTQ